MNNNEGASGGIPVILCVDVEPDEFFVDKNNPKPWSGFEFSHGYLRQWRSRFEDVTGRNAHFCWSIRMDPQVAVAYGSPTWVTDRYPDIFEEFRTMGDDLGIHVHTYRWSKSREGWVDDCGNPEWVSECLASSVDSFRKAFGESSQTLRFGNFWLGTRAVNEAENHGLRYDLTIEPGLQSMLGYGNKPPQSGPTPDFFRVPRMPYCPSITDFRKQSDTGHSRSITMIPLTSAHIELGWHPGKWRHRLGRLRRNGIKGRLQNQPLSMWRNWEGRDSFPLMLDRAIAVQKRPYLAFAIRSDINGKDFPAYDSCLKALLEHPLASRFAFCTPSEALGYLAP